MDRWLLNSLPTWALVLLVVGGTTCFGLGGFLTMRRLVPSLGRHAESRSLSSAFSISSGLFSFVLAFTIGQLYSNYIRASANVKQEATRIEQVLRVARGLPEPLAGEVRAGMLDYAAVARTTEWRTLREGKASPRAWEDIDRIYAALEHARTSDRSNTYYGQVLSGLDDLVAARQTRLDDANESLPPIFQVMLLLGAALALSSTFYFKPFGERLQVAMIGGASALIGTALLVALSLDYPYSGSVHVSSAAFARRTIVLLSGG